MSDLTKLTPYPGDEVAKQAFDVMTQRGWYAVQDLDKWAVGPSCHMPDYLLNARLDDPFTALVEADRWYKEHVETPTS